MSEGSAADYSAYLERVRVHAQPVLGLCHFALSHAGSPAFPCREYLGRLHRDASLLQELIDGHGAQSSQDWFPFREAVAAAKNFSGVTYDILHIRKAIPGYRLLLLGDRCAAATDAAFGELRDVILSVAGTIIVEARECALSDEPVSTDFEACRDDRVEFRLPADRTVRHVDRIGEQVVHMATQFLNLSEDSDVRAVLAERDEDEYEECIPEPISEERLRIVESRFHNLQSLYDTYIFESDLEQQNDQLRYLRGHISVIYHLLSVATNLVHYYIRHMSSVRRDTYRTMRFPITGEQLRNLVFGYPLSFARSYLESAVQLSQSMIQAYSVQTEITVPIPGYRGFHVRPSTLVARIVLHYGSRVRMVLDGQEYDAAAPLELFRANEAINRTKRRWIAAMLSSRPELQVPIPADFENLIRELQLIFVRLMNSGQIVMYDQDLSFDELQLESESTMADLVARSVRHFMSIAKVDVQSDLMVTFVGDSRALDDIRILAEHGYGEDRMGNNVVLPDVLSYLSR